MISKIYKKFSKTFFCLIAFIITTSIITTPVLGETLQEQLDRLEREIAAIQNEKNSLQSQIDANQYIINGFNSQLSALYGEVLVFQKEIDQLELQIKELEVSIQLIDEDIAKKKKDIETTEGVISELEVESNARIKVNYYNFRLYGGEVDTTTIFNTDSLNSFYKDSQYKELIQTDTNNIMVELAELRRELQEQKKELDERLANVKKEKDTVDVKKLELDAKKSELDVKIAAYYSEAAKLQAQNAETQNQIAVFSEDEARKKSEAESVRNAIFNSFNSANPGDYVTAGRPIGFQGATGWATGPHLHFMTIVNGGYQNPCNYLPAGAYGCGAGGSLSLPIQASAIFTSGYGQRCYWYNGTSVCDFHNAIDLQGTPWNTTIYAAHSGYYYRGVDPYGALYVIICENTNCNQGMKTGYWHLSGYGN